MAPPNVFDVEDVLSKMTLQEKVSMLVGEDGWTTFACERLGVPKTLMQDGPCGLGKITNGKVVPCERELAPQTCFPSPCLLAATWNRDMVHRVGRALGDEFSAEKFDVALAPGVNIKRTPVCGRNFEYFSEDPYVSGELGASYVQGVQDAGVGATVKHYCGNNQETGRFTVSSEIDERSLREIYLASFERIVKKASPWCIMSSYNLVNGEYVGSSRRFLTDILRNEWGFDGIVMSDWCAVADRTDAVIAGMDLEMPGPHTESIKRVLANVQSGKLDVKYVDDCVRRLLRYAQRAATISRPRAASHDGHATDFDAHHAVAHDAAVDGIVLLKNDSSLLPLDRAAKVAVVGTLAREPRFQGAGSAYVNAIKTDIPLDSIERHAGTGNVVFAPGYDLQADKKTDKEAAKKEASKLLQDAVQAARDCDCVVLFVSYGDDNSYEGQDRTDLLLPENQTQLIEAVSAVNPNTIVVLSTGSAVMMPWISKVKCILQTYLSGQACGSAIADILYGVACPSGKLPETYPMQLEDTPAYLDSTGDSVRVLYSERVYVGYRYYDKRHMEPLFPFGHGLSYTTFHYSDASTNKARYMDDEVVEAQVTVTNTGAMAGAEVVQLYVHDVKSTIDRPHKELKGFEKVLLQPGESRVVRFTLDRRAFAYYNIYKSEWTVEQGDFVLMFASSSRDVREEVTVHVSPVQLSLPDKITANTSMTVVLGLPGFDTVKSDLKKAVMNVFSAPELGDCPLRVLEQFSADQVSLDELDAFVEELNGLLRDIRNKA